MRCCFGLAAAVLSVNGGELSRRFVLSLIVVFNLGALAFGQGSDQLALADRAYVASKIYSLANTYFAHWSAVPDLDFEAHYKHYLDQALRAKDRFEFDLSTIEFVEGLHNAHSHFSDEWLTKNYGQPLGFRAKRVEEKWVITETIRPGLKTGDVIAAIDGTPVDDFIAARTKYRFARKGLEGQGVFWSSYMFPMRFTLTLADRREALIDRTKPIASPESRTSGKWISDNKLAYVAVPSFGDFKFEKAATDLVHQFKDAETLIVDVRGNGGGTTPQQLIDLLMDRPYRNPREATPLQIGAIQTSHDLPKQFDLSGLSEYARGGIDAFSGLDNVQFVWGGGLNRPKPDAFRGRVILLVDDRCASACEDFILPFKDNHRATLVGQTTWGSTGQPYIHNFGNGMRVFIGTKRVYMPDGTEIEGVGIRPDVAVATSLADVAGGRDTVLEKAIELATKHSD